MHRSNIQRTQFQCNVLQIFPHTDFSFKENKEINTREFF